MGGETVRASIAGVNAYQQLIAEMTHQADAERRSWRYTVQEVGSLFLFSMASLVPGAGPVFGALTPRLMLPTLSVGVCASLVSGQLYRRLGPDDLRYQRMEMIESFCMYSATLTLIVLSGLRWSPLYALSLFTNFFWALTKPFLQKKYAFIVGLAHGLHAAAWAVLGRWGDIGVTLAVGVVGFGAFVAVARSRRAGILAEADRNVARAKLKALQLDEERERIARTVAESVAARLTGIIAELQQGPTPLSTDRVQAIEQARIAQAELNGITSSSRGELPATLGDLSRLITSSVKPLCLEAELTSTFGGAPEASVAPGVALAATRIAQELVRNAITHGAARSVSVELGHDAENLSVRVSDDGVGLAADRLAGSTGGLRNVQRWASEAGGSVHRLATAGRGTTLRVTLRHSSP